MSPTWKISISTSAVSAEVYESALEPFSEAISVSEASNNITISRGLPEPANWAGDLWLAEACTIEAIATSLPNQSDIEQTIAVALLKLRFTDRLLEKEQTPAAPLCAVVIVVIIIIVVVLSLV